MPSKVNCWDERQCGRGPDGLLVARLGPCPAATDATCDGINGGVNAGRFCWAVAGEACCDPASGLPSESGRACSQCHFFRRVQQEEGCHFQYGRPGLGSRDTAALHRRLTDMSALMTIYRDVFASLPPRPLLVRIVEQLCAATSARAAGVYRANAAGELVLEARSGLFPLAERIDAASDSPPAAALRSGLCRRGHVAAETSGGAEYVLAQPIGGDGVLSGVLVLVKGQDDFTADDEWFLGEFTLAAGLGLRNARLSKSLHQLRVADRAQDRFIAALMHHIGSPLATISLSLQALSQLGDRLSAADRDSLINACRERANLIQTLTHELLDLAAIRSGGLFTNVRPVSPAQILRQEVGARQFQVRAHCIEMVLEGPIDCGVVSADPDGLRLVYGNLLDNAIKYSVGKGKVIRVSLSASPETMRACISDQGIGIPKEETGALFQKFHRATNAVALQTQGTGLGLAIVKELVERYGGQVSVVSRVGEGSAFTVELPRAPASAAAAILPESAAVGEQATAAKRPAAGRKELVDAATGFLACYGCGKCTAGCPTADHMDLKPHQVMRLLQLGQEEQVLAACGPWQCVGCQTCLARCPNAVDIPTVLTQIRTASMRRGSPAGAGGIPVFDQLFLDMVRRNGRANDGLIAMRYRMQVGGLMADWRLGLKMLKAGKMRLRVPPVTDREGVARLFGPGAALESEKP